MQTIKNLWTSEDVREWLSSLGAPYNELHAVEKFVKKDTRKKKAVVESTRKPIRHFNRPL